MDRFVLHSKAREQVLDGLAGVAARARALVKDRTVDRVGANRVMGFFYAVKDVMKRLSDTMGDMPPRLLADFEALLQQCSGPLELFRADIQEALVTITKDPRS
jgi:hypothetical protein